MEAKGKVTLKSSNKKSFKIGDDWYSAKEEMIPVLATINVDDEVTVTFEQNKTFRNVSNIVKTTVATPKGPTCEDCGKALKDDKFKKCYMCNKKNPVTPGTTATEKASGSSREFYGSPEDVAGKKRGCALGAAAEVLAGARCIVDKEPEEIAEITKIVAESLLDYLKTE